MTEDVCLVCFSMRLADRKERFLHARKGGRAGGIISSELDFQEPKQFLSRQKREMKIDKAAIEAGAQCRKIVMDG